MDQANYSHDQTADLGERRPTRTSRPAACGRRNKNISETERQLSTLGGSALLIAGLRRGRLSGMLCSLAGGALIYRGLTGHCHGYEALGIDTAEHSPYTVIPSDQGVKVTETVTVNRTREDLYSFWRNVENLPCVMRHLKRVEVIRGNRSRWVAEGPLGVLVEWEAEILNDHRPERIAWGSLPGGDIQTVGSVHFKALGGDRGTAVTVSMKYNPPGGKVGAAVASLLGSGLEQELAEDLRNFKNVMEVGEATSIQGEAAPFQM
jgi:uncharacterized membrane protein